MLVDVIIRLNDAKISATSLYPNFSAWSSRINERSKDLNSDSISETIDICEHV